MLQANSIEQSYHQLETLGRKDGVVYLKRLFAGRNDILLSIIDLINRPTIIISKGRSSDKLQKIRHNKVKAIVRIDPKKITGLECWDEESETFFYTAASAKRAIFLADNLAERGDAIFFAPLEYGKDNLEMYLQFDHEIESLLV
ncbi:MAG: hypothetical protein DRI54_07310 [Bacteroidetes bacterium]|nr:MAG: hypothetical protein DRI54_07310 [Bacteroidota bacterium]